MSYFTLELYNERPDYLSRIDYDLGKNIMKKIVMSSNATHRENYSDSISGITLSYESFRTFPLPSTPDNKIPLILFRTAPFSFDQIPDLIKNVLQNALDYNPGIIQVYLDDDDCRTFLKQHYPKHVRLFDSLKPGAFKADLVRICLLLKYGGVYSDIGHEYNQSFLPLLEDVSLVLTNEPSFHRPGVHNAWMAATKNHPIMNSFLTYISDKVARFEYGDNELDITGPKALIKSLALYHKGTLPDHGNLVTIDGHTIRVLYLEIEGWMRIEHDGVNILNTKFKNYRTIVYQNKPSYTKLWHARDVYHIMDMYRFSSFPASTKCMFRMSHYSLDDLPGEFKDIISETSKQHPDYSQVYMDDSDCLNFLKEHYPNYVPLWNKLVPGAFRSDMVRLCVIHKYGGVYNDIHHKYVESLYHFINPNADIVLVKEQKHVLKGIHNAFIYTKIPNHPLIKQMLDHITENITKEHYGENPLEITGPISLAYCMEKHYGIVINKSLHDGLHTIGNHTVQLLQLEQDGHIHYDGKHMICITKSNLYKRLMYEIRHQTHYHELWRSRGVYRS